MSDFAINISAVVPDVCWFKDGVVFNNEAAGCSAIDGDTGQVLATWPTTVDHEPWTPPSGVVNVVMRPNVPGA